MSAPFIVYSVSELFWPATAADAASQVQLYWHNGLLAVTPVARQLMH
jgi:hypothetical protein